MKQYQNKLISGLLVIVLLTLLFSLLLKVFHVRASDVNHVRKLMRQQEELAGAPDAEMTAPKVSRYGFSFKLPVAGEKGKHHWKITGGVSRSIDENRDLIYPFHGDFVEGGDPVSLYAPTIVFDKNLRLLTSDEPVVIDLSWSRHKGRGFFFDMEKRICKTYENSTTRINKQGAKSSPVLGGSAPDTGTEARRTMAIDTSGGTLTINADKFSYYMSEDRMLYQGNVFAWDADGVIKADVMEVFCYSEQEKQDTPTLSGVKRIICTGNVKIDQITKWAVGEKAVYDVARDVVTLTADAPRRAKYWELSDDEKEITIVGGQKIVHLRSRNEFTAETGATHQHLLASKINKVKILGFDSRKLGLIKPRTKIEPADEEVIE